MSIYPFKWPTGFSYKNGWSLFCFYIYEIYTYPSFQNTPPPSDEPLTKAKRHRPPRCRHGKSLPNTIFLEELSWQIITTTTARKQATVQKAFSVPLIIMAPMGARRVTVAKVFSALQTTTVPMGARKAIVAMVHLAPETTMTPVAEKQVIVPKACSGRSTTMMPVARKRVTNPKVGGNPIESERQTC